MSNTVHIIHGPFFREIEFILQLLPPIFHQIDGKTTIRQFSCLMENSVNLRVKLENSSKLIILWDLYVHCKGFANMI